MFTLRKTNCHFLHKNTSLSNLDYPVLFLFVKKKRFRSFDVRFAPIKTTNALPRVTYAVSGGVQMLRKFTPFAFFTSKKVNKKEKNFKANAMKFSPIHHTKIKNELIIFGVLLIFCILHHLPLLSQYEIYPNMSTIHFPKTVNLQQIFLP